MKLAISQPYFFPYIGYFQLIHAADKFILYDHIQYIKGGWIQRNRIMPPKSEEHFISIPLQKKSSNKLISELVICHDSPWQRKMLNQLRNAYTKSPFFNELFPLFEDLLMKDYSLLTEFNNHSITTIARLLGIQTPIVSDYQEHCPVEKVLGSNAWPYKTMSQRIFLICQHEKADTYINAIGGQALYSKQDFRDQNIALSFIQTDRYISEESQIAMPRLSIIDTLFHYGVEETKRLLNRYTLI